MDNLTIRKYLERYLDLYPDILNWWDKKVLPECRIVLPFYYHSGVAALAIIKNDGKLCHFSVNPNQRGIGLGTELLKRVREYPYRYGTVSDKVIVVHPGLLKMLELDKVVAINSPRLFGEEWLVVRPTIKGGE